MMTASAAGDLDDKGINGNEVDNGDNNNSKLHNHQNINGMRRKEKRKALKKMKRKQLRREKAIKEREEEEARLNDPEEQMRLLRLEEEEAEKMERDRLEFEERERRFLQELDLKKKRQEEEEEQRKLVEESHSEVIHNVNSNELNDSDEWEYVEEGPAEIIWKGNEIIVKKKKIRVPKKALNLHNEKQESERPISNPLAPQSEAFEDYRSAQEVLESVAQQVPNFGTEQDKAHCPFHLKTGACRFGARCSRVHFYPDKSCTLLVKNMYNGPGLAWEQDEGLEYTDEEVDRSFEDFYEDVHTEFLKLGEIVNFKVCKNASSHLRGNVYVHYKLLESAALAFQSINGRYFAGKQISCEFVNVTRWKVAICGEYMKSRLKTCSRGSACNFIHCFRNPGGDYEWADWDKPAPRYWLKKMDALFGCIDDRLVDEVNPGYHSRRSRSRGSEGNWSDEDDYWKRGGLQGHRGDNRRTNYFDVEMHEEKRNSQEIHHTKHRHRDAVEVLDESSDDRKSLTRSTRSSRKREWDPVLKRQGNEQRRHNSYPDKYLGSKKRESDRYLKHESRSSRRQKRMTECNHDQHPSRGKDDNLDMREGPYGDRHHDKHSSRKGKHSLPRKKADSLDIDSYRDGLDRGEDRCHRHSEKISRKANYEAELSDNGSHGVSIGRNEKNPHKNMITILRSKSELSDDSKFDRKEGYHGHGGRSTRHHSKKKVAKRDSNACRCSVDRDKPNNKDEEDLCSYGTGKHRNSHTDIDQSLSGEDEIGVIHQTSSFRNTLLFPTDSDSQEDNINRYKNGEMYHDLCNEGHESERHHKRFGIEPRNPMSDSDQKTAASHDVEAGDTHNRSQDNYRQSQTEREQAYRFAALKKLEEMRNSKDSPAENAEHIDLMENYSHNNLPKSTGVGKDMEPSSSSQIDRGVAVSKRRRI